MSSDLINSTFGILALILVVLLCSWAVLRRKPDKFARLLSAVWGFVSSRLVLAVLVMSSSAIAGFAIYMAYVAPLNIMQDIASAQEFLKGNSLYPSNMNELMRESMRKEPPRLSLGRWSPRLRDKEAREQLAAGFTAVQAHPPLMTLMFAPLVALFGVRGTCVAFSMLSLAALLWTNSALFLGLDLHLSFRERAVVSFGILGWYPVISTLRWGQSGIVLAALIVGGWFFLRRNRPVLAGVCIALATCLKVFPGLLLVYLLFRHRRAFVAATLSMVVLLGLPAVITGWQSYRDYSDAGRFVLTRFGGMHHNLSLLGVVVRQVGPYLGSGYYQTTPTGMALYIGIGASLVAIFLWLVLRRPGLSRGSLPAMDLEYSLVVGLMPLLSPLSWDHYMCVLLLPILVLSRRILADGSEGVAVLGLLGLLTALAIPAWTFHFGTRVAPASVAMLVLWSWIAVLYWRWKRQPAGG